MSETEGHCLATLRPQRITASPQLGLMHAAGRYDKRSRNVQELVAPFALGNPGCSGNESRLVDCPVDDSKDPEYNGFYFQSDYNRGDCDPYAGTFAMIACGSDQVTGVYSYSNRWSDCVHILQKSVMHMGKPQRGRPDQHERIDRPCNQPATAAPPDVHLHCAQYSPQWRSFSCSPSSAHTPPAQLGIPSWLLRDQRFWR